MSRFVPRRDPRRRGVYGIWDAALRTWAAKPFGTIGAARAAAHRLASGEQSDLAYAALGPVALHLFVALKAVEQFIEQEKREGRHHAALAHIVHEAVQAASDQAKIKEPNT